MQEKKGWGSVTKQGNNGGGGKKSDAGWGILLSRFAAIGPGEKRKRGRDGGWIHTTRDHNNKTIKGCALEELSSTCYFKGDADLPTGCVKEFPAFCNMPSYHCLLFVSVGWGKEQIKAKIS